MRNNVVLTALSSALAVSFALIANQAVAEIKVPLSGTVTLGETLCGSYSAAIFDESGNLKLVGNSWTCLGGETGGGETGGGETGGGETGGGETGGGETGGGETGGGETGGGETGGGETVVDPSCGTIPKGVVTNFNHPWDNNIAANIRNPIGLTGTNAYSLKINKPIGVKGYGNILAASTANRSEDRTLVISDCPGSMVPAKTSITYKNGNNACVSGGIENALKWTNDLNSKDVAQCKLDPAKQYYINISHVNSSTGRNTCSSGTCNFIYEYKMLGLIK